MIKEKLAEMCKEDDLRRLAIHCKVEGSEEMDKKELITALQLIHVVMSWRKKPNDT